MGIPLLSFKSPPTRPPPSYISLTHEQIPFCLSGIVVHSCPLCQSAKGAEVDAEGGDVVMERCVHEVAPIYFWQLPLVDRRSPTRADLRAPPLPSSPNDTPQANTRASPGGTQSLPPERARSTSRSLRTGCSKGITTT